MIVFLHAGLTYQAAQANAFPSEGGSPSDRFAVTSPAKAGRGKQ